VSLGSLAQATARRDGVALSLWAIAGRETGDVEGRVAAESRVLRCRARAHGGVGDAAGGGRQAAAAAAGGGPAAVAAAAAAVVAAPAAGPR